MEAINTWDREERQRRETEKRDREERERERERAGGQPPDMSKALSNSQQNTSTKVSFLMKLLAKGSAQVLCREFWEAQLLGTNFSHNTPGQLLLGKHLPEMVLSSNNYF